MHDDAITLKWRTRFDGWCVTGIWFVGAVMICGIVWDVASKSPYAWVAWIVWGLLFLCFSYLVLALSFNSTTVRRVAGQLLVRNGPIPAGENSLTDVADITEIYTASALTPPGRATGYTRIYTVHARTKNGVSLPLFTMANIADRARAEDFARRVRAMIQV